MRVVATDPADKITYRGKAFVRGVGAVLIAGCCLMVGLGATVLAERLQGPGYVLYWSACLVLTLAAGFVAVLDLILIRRASQQTRRELLHHQFTDKD